MDSYSRDKSGKINAESHTPTRKRGVKEHGGEELWGRELGNHLEEMRLAPAVSNGGGVVAHVLEHNLLDGENLMGDVVLGLPHGRELPLANGTAYV